MIGTSKFECGPHKQTSSRIAYLLVGFAILGCWFWKASHILPAASSPVDTRENEQKAIDTRDNEQIFLDTARSFKPVTDKVTSHTYQIMYGQHLIPYYKKNPNMKMLEIGLGCDMSYGPGASVNVWKKLFPQAELWEAEFDQKYVEAEKATRWLPHFNR